MKGFFIALSSERGGFGTNCNLQGARIIHRLCSPQGGRLGQQQSERSPPSRGRRSEPEEEEGFTQTSPIMPERIGDALPSS